jgi:hypothetical protein
MHAGIESGKLLKALSADDSAVLRQFVPWEFTGEPLVYMRGRYVRVEAGWPPELAENMIRLSSIGQRPRDGGRWLAGKNELGQIVTLGLSDSTPHFLLAGQTGSGKSVGMLAAACQLGQDWDNQLVLLDGKYGVDLSKIAHMPTLAGPLAVDCEMAQAALSWCIQQMRQRYGNGRNGSRLIILWDEPQEWLAQSPALVEMTRRLLAQGRGANVHMLMSTQHPVVSVFGDSTSKRNLTGRVALKVADFEASRVAVGGAQPRADRLLGAGDSYCVAPGAVHRTQLVYVDEQDFDSLPAGEPLRDNWPEHHCEDLGQPLPFTPAQTAEAIIVASEGNGRPTLERRADVGSTVGRNLLKFGRDVYDILTAQDYRLCEIEMESGLVG